jgi:transposase-like protein
VNESKFGKRKYNRGHRVEAAWVIGGVERTAERRIFAVLIAERSADTLKTVLERNICPGSIVNTDSWSGYRDADLVGLKFK